MTTSIGGTDVIFGDIHQPKALPLSRPKARWGDFGRETKILLKGYVRKKNRMPSSAL